MDWGASRPKRIKAAAYRYAEGAPDDRGREPEPPPPLLDLHLIDRFGVKAILGRDVLSYREIASMNISENVVKAYQSRRASGDWGKWAEANRSANRVLIEIEKAINAD